MDMPPVPSQLTLSLMNFIISNEENFQTNSSVNNNNTRNKHHLTDQKPNYPFSKEYVLYRNKNIPTVYHFVSQPPGITKQNI
jgi:hypothetical protein